MSAVVRCGARTSQPWTVNTTLNTLPAQCARLFLVLKIHTTSMRAKSTVIITIQPNSLNAAMAATQLS